MSAIHRTAIFVLVTIAALVGIGVILYGSPKTGMQAQGSRYLSESAAIGQDVHFRAAEICYPNRRKYERYNACCSEPCVKECTRKQAPDLKACQSVCQNWCIKAVTEVYLERPIGFVGASSKGMKKQDYVVYTN